jgi:hypothetical protein
MNITITITPSGEDEYELVSAPGEEAISDEVLVEERLGQVVELVRGESAAIHGRGNRRARLEFTVTRRHGSVADAIAFEYGHPGEVPHEGELRIEVEENSATRTFVGSAVVTGVELVRRRGMTTVWRYQMLVTGLEEQLS